MDRTASCSCGSLRITCIGDPRKVSLCHCLSCQKRTGSTYGVAAFFGREEVRVEGASGEYTRKSDSGFRVTHHFCRDCGATVYWLPERMPELVAVGIGSFADPAFPPPTQAVHRETRHPWVKDMDGQAG